MALAYVGGQVAGFAGTLSAQTVTFALTNGLASVPAAGDLVVIAYATSSTANRSLAIRDTGAVDYTIIGTELYSNSTWDSNLRVAYKVMSGTPDTQFVLTETVGGGTGSTADAGRYTVHVFRGVDAAILDVTTTTATAAANPHLPNPPSITPTTTGAWIYVVGSAAGAESGAFTAAYLTDFRSGATADTNDAIIGSGYVVWTSDAYNPAAFGGGGSSEDGDTWCALTAVIKPASDALADRHRPQTQAVHRASNW